MQWLGLGLTHKKVCAGGGARPSDRCNSESESGARTTYQSWVAVRCVASRRAGCLQLQLQDVRVRVKVSAKDGKAERHTLTSALECIQITVLDSYSYSCSALALLNDEEFTRKDFKKRCRWRNLNRQADRSRSRAEPRRAEPQKGSAARKRHEKVRYSYTRRSALNRVSERASDNE